MHNIAQYINRKGRNANSAENIGKFELVKQKGEPISETKI